MSAIVSCGPDWRSIGRKVAWWFLPVTSASALLSIYGVAA